MKKITRMLDFYIIFLQISAIFKGAIFYNFRQDLSAGERKRVPAGSLDVSIYSLYPFNQEKNRAFKIRLEWIHSQI